MAWLMAALLVTLCLWPLVPLFRYYEHETAIGETNAPYLAFFDEFIRQWRGETIFVSDSPLNNLPAIEYLLAVNRVPYTFMPVGRILERLATRQEAGRVTLILYNDELSRARSQADLMAWDSPVIQAARKVGYGVYTISDAQQVRKPTFVFTNTALAPAVRIVQANFADQLGLTGYEARAETVAPGGELVVNVHWQAISAMPEAYTGFLHLVGPDGRLVAQDDHELGRGFYRTVFWQPGELVRERYTLDLPKGAPSGEYTLLVGAYSFPSLKRLPVRSASTFARDDVVTLGSINVKP